MGRPIAPVELRLTATIKDVGRADINVSCRSCGGRVLADLGFPSNSSRTMLLTELIGFYWQSLVSIQFRSGYILQIALGVNFELKASRVVG